MLGCWPSKLIDQLDCNRYRVATKAKMERIDRANPRKI
jgi:hypothetical protein